MSTVAGQAGRRRRSARNLDEAPGGACDLHVDPFAVHVRNVNLDSQNWTADLGFDVVEMVGAFTGTD